MKKKRINYFNYFSLFFAITLLVFIAGCSGTPPIVPIINSVTYDGNGNTSGVVPTDANLYEQGALVTVLGNTGDLTRINDGGTSYYFVCWNTKADCSGTAQGEGDTFTMGETNVILYAQWKSYVLRGTGPAGGHIFYDKGSYSDGWRYLEAAPVSTEWTVRLWSSSGTLIGGTETDIGAGQSNTTTIVTWLNSHSETSRAAQRCNDLIVDVYSDWFLPSKDELNLMYTNLHTATGGAVGDFADFYYWSSSEYDADDAWFQLFTDGWQDYTFKYSALQVRAVRAF